MQNMSGVRPQARRGPHRVTIVDANTNTRESNFSACEHASVYLTASLCMLILSAVAYTVSISSSNWSASGHFMKMGLWDFCITRTDDLNEPWTCFPVNADFSVATQVFGILAIVCFACGFLFYLLQTIFHNLRKSRPLIIGMCATAFCIVTLQMMMLIVYAMKNGRLYKKIVRDYFIGDGPPAELLLSWGYYFTTVSALLSTMTGILLFVEYRNLTFRSIYGVRYNGK